MGLPGPDGSLCARLLERRDIATASQRPAYRHRASGTALVLLLSAKISLVCFVNFMVVPPINVPPAAFPSPLEVRET